jgi:hypothetical protein
MSVSLHIESSFNAAWETVLWPWFESVLPETWKNQLPSLVIVPTRGQATDLKTRLIAKGATYLGLQFVTPASLRALLARSNATPRTEPEHLRLLLSLAATEIDGQPNESETLAAKSVARSPGPLLNTLDRLENAGWKFDQLAVPSFLPVVQRFKELCAQCNFVLPAEADRRDLKSAKASDLKFANVLVTGFGGAHWPHWFLLRTAIQLAEKATVVLEEPRGDLSETDLCWIGSWEEIGGEAKRPTSSRPMVGDSLFSEAEMRGGAQRGAEFDFLIGTNISEQAEAITWQCARYLADDTCTRLGVVFPSNGALSRLVSTSLARLEIPHNDGLAHIVPGIFESAEWQSWIDLQRAPGLTSFLHFLNALSNPGVVFPNISRQNLEAALREGYSDLLLDDLDILREFCLKQASEKFRSAGEALRSFPFLPTQATLPEFLEQTQIALEHLGWKQQTLEIATVTQSWPNRIDAKFSRALFLRWLQETGATFGAARSAGGDHPYARVQLLTVTQAQHQDWSHLIFAGWNEGAWPPTPGMEFARPEEIHAFNRNVQQLNKRAARQGSQGEGHTSVRENQSLYLGPNQQRAIALRQVDALLESVSERVTLAASLLQEDAPERFWNPSECFTQFFLQQRREPLTQITLKRLQSVTAEFVDKARAFGPKSKTSDATVQQTLAAFNARRDATKPASEYDFALRPDASDRPVSTLSVSDLERTVTSPAIVWMKRYLRVEAPDDVTNPWATSTGKWVHRWLAKISDSKDGKLFAAFPSPTSIDEQICASAGKACAMLQELSDSLGKIVPDWWRSGWLNAQFLARHLGNKIASAQDWKWMVTELPIGHDAPVKLADGIELELRGQIDLVLAQTDAANFAGQKIWIVDYKTGANKELKKNDLHDYLVKGTALQLGLYALAIRELGATEVEASILSAVVKNVAPQLSIVDLALHIDVFAALAEMQRTGIFGMKGEIRPSFRYGTPYPLATLSIDNDILEEKWERTHPALVLEKEEWEIW